MNAGPQLREKLIIKKMEHWMLMGKYPSIYGRRSASRARKNFWALVRRYPELAAKRGLTEASVI
jgi:hypothetical protein